MIFHVTEAARVQSSTRGRFVVGFGTAEVVLPFLAGACGLSVNHEPQTSHRRLRSNGLALWADPRPPKAVQLASGAWGC